jgi:cephalosporin-C deacetylase-like acetyl esterase
MVPLGALNFQYGIAPPVYLPEYWLDRHEVTNRQFQEFVAAGGYTKRDFWKTPFVENNRELRWEDAMARFRDATGRTGPSTWELGNYADGKADYPVAGVSWYEAAAYAEFAGKSLPTVYHWFRAAGATGDASGILLLSNFSGEGPAAACRFPGITSVGACDMAGNLREWCWNQAGHLRYILGGSWRDPAYMFENTDARSPFDRDPTNGFRCVKYSGPVDASLTAPIEKLQKDFKNLRPVSDEVFQAFRRLYAYDRTELESRVDSINESSPYWREEKVTFNAAYGNERVIAYLFLPRNATPPFQTVVFNPGSGAALVTSSKNLLDIPTFVVRAGRALLYPIYKGEYERGTGTSMRRLGRNAIRDLAVAVAKDGRRAMDYLETRSDIDAGRIAYWGHSLGAVAGPMAMAIEPRFKAAVLVVGGIPGMEISPEIDPVNFAPRAKLPVLMINGRDDFEMPMEGQLAMFRLLGTPPSDKRQIHLPGGHDLPRVVIIKEGLDWLDRYLGKVKMR